MSALMKGIENLVGVGLHLLFLCLVLEAVTLAVRGRFSVPISMSFSLQVLLSIPCIAACLSGAIWFSRSLNLVRVHLLREENELVTHGPFAYVRHPLYSSDVNPPTSYNLAFGPPAFHPMGGGGCGLPHHSSY